MRASFLSGLMGLALGILPVAADQQGAEREVARYERAVNVYNEALTSAATPAERAEADDLRPRPAAYGVRLIGQLKGNWRQKWVVPHIAWVLNNAPDVPKEQIAGLKKVFRQVHIRTEGAGQVAYGLRNISDPDSLELAEEVLEKNPNKVDQGLAALGIAQMLTNLGDDPRIVARRLEMLRKAIIESADEMVAGQKVADVAAESLFILNNLSKGRNAPELEGQDLAGDALTLSSQRGKVTALVFWSTQPGAQGEETLKWMKETSAELAGQNFTLLGVSVDAESAVRRMVADGEISWPNILDQRQEAARLYRVRSLPVAYVIDQEGVIQYKGVPGSFVTFAIDALLQPQAGAAAGAGE